MTVFISPSHNEVFKWSGRFSVWLSCLMTYPERWWTLLWTCVSILASVNDAPSQFNFVHECATFQQKTQLKHTANRRSWLAGENTQTGNTSNHSRTAACVIKLRAARGGKNKWRQQTFFKRCYFHRAKYIFVWFLKIIIWKGKWWSRQMYCFSLGYSSLKKKRPFKQPVFLMFLRINSKHEKSWLLVVDWMGSIKVFHVLSELSQHCHSEWLVKESEFGTIVTLVVFI